MEEGLFLEIMGELVRWNHIIFQDKRVLIIWMVLRHCDAEGWTKEIVV